MLPGTMFEEFTRLLAGRFEALRGGVLFGEPFVFGVATVFDAPVFCSAAFEVKIENSTGSARRHKRLFNNNF